MTHPLVRPSAFRHWYFASAPAERLAALRVLVGGYALGWLAIRTPHLLRLLDHRPSRFDGVGVLAFLDAPVPDALGLIVLAAAVASGAAFVVGWRYGVTGPAFAVLLLLVTTYRNCWGDVLHTDNLLVLHVAVLGIVAAADAWSIDRRRRDEPTPPPSSAYGWPVRLLCVVTVLTYVVAGWAKLRNSGVDWAFGEILRNHVANDNLRKILLGDSHSPFGAWAVGQPWLFPPLAAVTLVVELGAPVALLGRRWRTGWVAAAWLFHLGIAALMWITFPYPLSGVAFAPFFRVERAVGRQASPARKASTSARSLVRRMGGSARIRSHR